MSKVQLIIIYLLVVSCSSSQKRDLKERKGLFSLLVRPTWFQYRKDRSLIGEEGEVTSHPFFDFNPFVNFKNKTLNFFVTTPEKSSVYYDFDLSAGKRFRKHNLCKRSDVWQKYGPVSLPPYTEGVVPRTLDQLGDPQKIWVFGGDESFEKRPGEYAHRVKVLGGIIQQYCKKGECRPKEWQSRVILIGVNLKSEFRSYNTLTELKKKIDWQQVEAYSNTAEGIKFKYERPFPAYRITGEISSREALKFALIPSHYFDKKDILGIQKSCHKLYDHIQKNLGQENSLKAFQQKFIKIHEKFYKRIYTCMKYVRTSSINYSPKRHWFLAMYEAFYNLHFLDYVYSCNSQIWLPRKGNVQLPFNEKTYLRNCLPSELDAAFDQAIFTLNKLRNNDYPSYYYIEYDSLRGGSHEKIYSWVYHDGLTLDCRENISKSNMLFPKDIKWQTKMKNKGLIR